MASFIADRSRGDTVAAIGGEKLCNHWVCASMWLARIGTDGPRGKHPSCRRQDGLPLFLPPDDGASHHRSEVSMTPTVRLSLAGTAIALTLTACAGSDSPTTVGASAARS